MSDDFLGLGSYGIVVSDPESDTCRKIFTKDRAMSLIREAFMIQKLSHIGGITEMVKLDQPTAIDTQMIQQKRTGDQPAWGVIVMKRYHMTLHQWFRTNPPYRSRFRIMREIIRIIAEIHAAGVIHADLKLENIMLTESGDVRIIDWGLSSFKGYARVHGTTKTYRPQRIIQDYCHDIYSLGVLMIQLLLGSFLINTLEYTSCVRMLDTAIANSSFRKLISRMIHPECKIRPSIYEITAFFGISVDYTESILPKRTASLNIPSSYGVANVAYPIIFRDFLITHPDAYPTLICILGAIYRCVDPRPLLLQVNYCQVMEFMAMR